MHLSVKPQFRTLNTICVWDSNLEEPHTQYFRPGGALGEREVLEQGVARSCGRSWPHLDVSSGQPLVAGGEDNPFGKSIKHSGLLQRLNSTQTARLCGIIFGTQHHSILPTLKILIQLRENNLQISQYLSDLKGEGILITCLKKFTRVFKKCTHKNTIGTVFSTITWISF